MADPRTRKTGEHNANLVKLIADGVAMRERIEALEARVARLEAELAARPSATKRPAPVGPPPLPKMPSVAPRPSSGASMPALPKSSGRRSVVDISEIAELVDSIPPPAPRPRK
ncbi:MAG: hypothetical protein JWP87_4017 [Labilithrix sp.]|nr:hypothetical protein [Labilithrix sp.]